MPSRDPRIDAYIAKSAPFAQPILTHIREVVHAACPEVEETMKWSSPHFDHHGIMCAMSAFKAHCALGFWKASLIPGLATGDGAAGNFGRITSLDDLPSKTVLMGYMKAAMRLNDEGVTAAKPKKKAPAAERPVPPELAAALAKNRAARAVFDAFPASHRREYIDWIADAKRDETRARRVEQAVEWIAEGKQRNWKYQG